MQRLIEVENLTLQFRTDEGLITAVENLSFSLESGEVMGLVGESGVNLSAFSFSAAICRNLTAPVPISCLQEHNLSQHIRTCPKDTKKVNF